MDLCDLREANGVHGAKCDSESCIFWRAVEQIGGAPGEGCAIKHYRLLGDEDVAAWLLTVKQRVDSADEPAGGSGGSSPR